MNARPEDQTANLNRCLFFITPLISYATPPFYSEFRLPRVYTLYSDGCTSVYPSHIDGRFQPPPVRIRNGLSPLFFALLRPTDHPRPSFFTESTAPQFHLALSSMAMLSGDASKVTGIHRVYTHAVPRIPALDQFTRGASFWRIQAYRETHTHTDECIPDTASVLPANYFCLASLETITFFLRV